MQGIATLSNDLDFAAKFFRVMEKAGITDNHLKLVVDDKGARENLAAFFQAGCPKLPPPVFERNEYGHIIITVTGLDLTGAQEIERLEAAGFRVSDYAKSCLTSTKADGYDKNHRLEAGKQYKIALVLGKEIKRDADRTTEALQKLGEKYGYQKPMAGIVPRIRESVTDKQMEEMGFWYIAGLHDTIEDSGGNPYVLVANRNDGGRWLSACWDGPQFQWYDDGCFAFLVPAK